MAKKQKKEKLPRAADANRDVCFVICPFGGWHDRYSKDIFYPAVEDAGLKPLRADDIFGPSSIVSDIWQSVRRAKIVLADLTGRNPNVLYELGLAHAIQRPVVMVTQSMGDVPFDLRALRVIVYDLQAPNWGAALQHEITKSLREVVASPERFVPATFLDQSPKRTGGTVEPQEKRILQLEQQVASMQRTLQSSTLNPIYYNTVSTFGIGSDAIRNYYTEHPQTIVLGGDTLVPRLGKTITVPAGKLELGLPEPSRKEELKEKKDLE